jgi:uncharacterized protein (TIGR00288 family)
LEADDAWGVSRRLELATAESTADRHIAVLIDFENVGLSSIQWLFDQISDVGRIIVRRAYGDWSEASGSRSRDHLLELGIEPIHLFRSAGAGKNSSDIRLAIDAVDLLHLSPVDTFVVVSSDSDFVPLVSKLRAAGKTVFGAGRKAAASSTLVRSCDRYFYLEQGDRTPSGARSPQEPPKDSLLARAVKSVMDEQGKALGSRLHQTILRLDPSFDFRGLGHSTFTRFLEASPEVRVTRPRGPGDVAVELADTGQATPSQPPTPGVWGPGVDAAWSARATGSGQAITANTAASDAAKVLGASKLSASPYKRLDRLLNASELLRSKWMRTGNTIVRR